MRTPGVYASRALATQKSKPARGGAAKPAKPGGRVVFVTSHQAHFHGLKSVPAEYIPIAESKRACEDSRRAMRADLAQRGVSLSVVSGDMIEGTIIVRLLERRDPDAIETPRIRPTPHPGRIRVRDRQRGPQRSTRPRHGLRRGADYPSAAATYPGRGSNPKMNPPIGPGA